MREIHAYRIGALIRACFPSTWRPDAFCCGFAVFYWAPPTALTIAHERVHLKQARQLGLLRWYWRYLLELKRHGYTNSFFELQARYEAEQEVRRHALQP